jgi:PHD/YefM family antitoxin component YafN of YafNO toxin-antitoxin module
MARLYQDCVLFGPLGVRILFGTAGFVVMMLALSRGLQSLYRLHVNDRLGLSLVRTRVPGYSDGGLIMLRVLRTFRQRWGQAALAEIDGASELRGHGVSMVIITADNILRIWRRTGTLSLAAADGDGNPTAWLASRVSYARIEQHLSQDRHELERQPSRALTLTGRYHGSRQAEQRHQAVSEFPANATEMIEHVRHVRRPLVLTRRVHSAAVLLDVEENENLLQEMGLLRDVRLAETQFKAGKSVSHRVAEAQIRGRINR